MARGNSALKSKQPKVAAGNKERAVKVMMRVEGGQAEVLGDVSLHHWGVVPPSQVLSSLEIVGDGAWIPRANKDGIEPGDDEVNLAFVVNTIGVMYERLLDPPPEIAGLVDPVAWTRRACESLKRAAGQSPRCALVEGESGDSVCIVDYAGPALDPATAQPIAGVTVFYPSICRYADSTSRLTAEPNMAQEWISTRHPMMAMRLGVNRILYRVRKDMLVEVLRKKNHPLLFEWDPADIIPDLEPEEDGPKRKYTWAGPVTITRPDGTTVEVEAEEGILYRKQLIRSRETEYLETGSKKLTRAAEEDALARVYMSELLAYVKKRDNPRYKTNEGDLTRHAAWLLFLNREDSLREVGEMTTVEDSADVLERAGKLAREKGLTMEDIDPEKMAQRIGRLTHSSSGIGKRYGKLQPGAIASEWNDVLPFTLYPYQIKKAQALLNEATDWYMHQVKSV